MVEAWKRHGRSDFMEIYLIEENKLFEFELMYLFDA